MGGFMQHKILIVDDNKSYLHVLKSFLEEKNYIVHQAENAMYAASLVHLNKGKYSLALVDYHMPDIMGDDAIRILQKKDPSLQIVAISGDNSSEAEVANVGAGAYALIDRNKGLKAVFSFVESYCKRYQEKLKVFAPEDQTPSDLEKFIASFDMVGASPQTAEVCRLISVYAPTTDCVLIRGENGTGKELVAKAIHKKSKYSNGPFIAINCSAINSGTFESELFGSVKGSYTSSVEDKAGFFRQANGGTLFMDEIGDLSIELQSKLLRAIQEKEVTPVGGAKSIKVNVRIVAATNVDLEKAVQLGKFREDLFYRLDCYQINLKPLQERTDDIPPLVMNIANKWCSDNQIPKKVFLASTIDALKKHSWPGNVRALQNSVKRALNQAKMSETVEIAHLDEVIRSNMNSTEEIKSLAEDKGNLEVTYKRDKAKMYLNSILENGGSATKAAKALGIPKSTFHDHLKALGINLKTLAKI